jgi:hypothetical protein
VRIRSRYNQPNVARRLRAQDFEIVKAGPDYYFRARDIILLFTASLIFNKSEREEIGSLLELAKILETLAKKRSVFHSEADFQHALAWQIHNVRPDASIRLELPVRADDGRAIHLDLLVICGQQRFAIELKYKTALLDARLGSEQFLLRAQSAQDCGRYDFLSDVARLERYVRSEPNAIGYAVLLSNDKLYWEKSGRRNLSADFSIYDSREITSKVSLDWSGPGYTKGREEKISCQSGYSCSWRDYSTIKENDSTMKNGRFRYLLLTVQPPSAVTASSAFRPLSPPDFPEGVVKSIARWRAVDQTSDDRDCWIEELRAPFLLANPAEFPHESPVSRQPPKPPPLLETVVKQFCRGKLVLIG